MFRQDSRIISWGGEAVAESRLYKYNARFHRVLSTKDLGVERCRLSRLLVRFRPLGGNICSFLERLFPNTQDYINYSAPSQNDCTSLPGRN